MADDIRIRVGVTNNVKAGMDSAVADVQNGAGRMRGAMDRSMRGKGFMEAFMKAVRGDVSGAIEDLQERMGAGMNGIAAKALTWGAGIATALFAGFKAGQQLDKTFGISDKIGNFLGNRFGTQEDQGLKDQLESLRVLRQARDEAAAAEIENQRKITQARIDAIEAENEEYKEAANLREDEARQRNRDRNRWQEDWAAGGLKQDVIGRITGRPELDMGAAADREVQLALDDDFRRQEQRAERATSRQRSRYDRLLFRATRMSAEERARNPQLRRLFEAEQKRANAANLKDNLEQLQKRAAEAAIKSADDMAIVKRNTEELKGLQKLLTMK